MPGTELRGPTAHTRIGPQRGRLRNAAIVFEQISSRRRRQARHVDRRRRCRPQRPGGRLGRARVRSPRAPTACSRSSLDESVEVAPEIDRLRRDHEVLVAHITRARELLASPGAGPDDTRILLALTGIAKLVDQHRRRGADLLYRVYSVDVSAGD